MLINGLSLVHIELKKRGIEIKKPLIKSTTIKDIRLDLIRRFLIIFKYLLSQMGLILNIMLMTNNSHLSKLSFGRTKTTTISTI